MHIHTEHRGSDTSCVPIRIGRTPFEGVVKYIEKNNHSLIISINNGDVYLFPIEDQINNLQFMKSIKNIEYGFSFSLL